jgi:hypothetical protein
MRFRTLILTAACASIGLGAAAPAFADDDWRRDGRHERQEMRERQWRGHEWREHEAREHEWRERQRWEYNHAPPVMVVPGYGSYPPPPVYYNNPGYVR